MEQKNIMEILNEIRDYRNRELSNLKDNRVFYTIAMSLGEGQKSKKEIYRVIEEYSIGENESKVRELFYEYDENGLIKLAELDPEKSEEILFNGDPSTMSEQEYKNWELVLEDIIEGREKNKEKLYEHAIEFGINEEEVRGLSEIDVYKRIDEKEKEKNKDKDEDKENADKEKDIEIPKEDAQKRGIIGMNTIPLSQRVGIHGETLKSELGLDQYKEYSDVIELEIVPSYKLAYLGEKVRDIPFVAVGKRQNGEVVVFPENVCKPYKGANNEIVKEDGKDDNVTKEKSDCMITFKNGKSLAIDQKEEDYGIVDGSLVYNTRDNDGRIALDLQNKLEDGTRQQDTETREQTNPWEGEEHIRNKKKEADTHSKEEYEQGKVKSKDVDGDPNTKTHEHVEAVNEDVEKAVDEIMDSLKLERESSREEIKAALLERMQEKEKSSADITKNVIETAKDEIKEEFEKTVEEQYRGNPNNL